MKPLWMRMGWWVIGGMFLAASPVLAQEVQSVCGPHDFAVAGESSCTYCHNAEEPGDPNFTIRADSDFCLTCHDGSTLEAAQHISPGSSAERMSGPLDITQRTAVDHPFGVFYEEARQLSPTLQLRPLPLPPPLKLFEGRVECASCHEPHDCSIKPFLRVTSEKSALCLGCHKM